jgi:hypothetical protein
MWMWIKDFRAFIVRHPTYRHGRFSSREKTKAQSSSIAPSLKSAPALEASPRAPDVDGDGGVRICPM